LKPDITTLKIKLFADGADLNGMFAMASKPYISGLTTNPTLMRKAGISDYEKFAKSALEKISDKPISFEVFSDELHEMVAQGMKIASWGENVFVKIPVTNTRGISTIPVVERLSDSGVKVNVTAVMTEKQVSELIGSINPNVLSYISIFAGRIADTGRDPLPIMKNSVQLISTNQNCELIWASPRELLNVFQAEGIGCQVITATSEILNKISLIGKDLTEYSLETVKMFFEDAKSSRFLI
jgi:transaldolase